MSIIGIKRSCLKKTPSTRESKEPEKNVKFNETVQVSEVQESIGKIINSKIDLSEKQSKYSIPKKNHKYQIKDDESNDSLWSFAEIRLKQKAGGRQANSFLAQDIQEENEAIYKNIKKRVYDFSIDKKDIEFHIATLQNEKKSIFNMYNNPDTFCRVDEKIIKNIDETIEKLTNLLNKSVPQIVFDKAIESEDISIIERAIAQLQALKKEIIDQMEKELDLNIIRDIEEKLQNLVEQLVQLKTVPESKLDFIYENYKKSDKPEEIKSAIEHYKALLERNIELENTINMTKNREEKEKLSKDLINDYQIEEYIENLEARLKELK